MRGEKRLYNFVAYIAVFTTALSIMLSYLLDAYTNVAKVCDWIAFVGMLVVTAVGAFYYARSKRRLIWMLLYVGAMVIIFIFKIIPLF